MTAKRLRNVLNLSKRKEIICKTLDNQQRESSSDKLEWDGILFHEEKNMKWCFAELGAKI